MAYSKERRAEVLAASDAGEGTRAVALRFDCSESWVRRVKQERRELGKVAPATTRKRVPSGPRIASGSGRSSPSAPTSRCENSRRSSRPRCRVRPSASRFGR